MLFLVAIQINPSLYPPKDPYYVNSAFVFIKPLARTETMVSLVRGFLAEKGFIIASEGVVGSITENLLDRQYPRLARFSLILKPSQLDLSPVIYIRFQKKFSTSWIQALQADRILNAIDAARALSIDVFDLHDLWVKAVKENLILKLDRGVYCGMIKREVDDFPIFCVNGFYPSMRTRYTASISMIHFFQVDWMSYLMDWSSFLENVIGRENESIEKTNTLKYLITSEWESLNIKEDPNYIYNSVHASQSAFEAMIEYSTWLSQPISTSSCGMKLMNVGIPQELLSQWSRNPVVDGERIFDRMKDKGTDECVAIASQIWQSIKPLSVSGNYLNQLSFQQNSTRNQNYSRNISTHHFHSPHSLNPSPSSPLYPEVSRIRIKDHNKSRTKNSRSKKIYPSPKKSSDKSDRITTRILSI